MRSLQIGSATWFMSRFGRPHQRGTGAASTGTSPGTTEYRTHTCFPPAPGSPSIPVHKKILRAPQAQMDHTRDVLPRCREIADMAQAGIADGFFSEGFVGLCLVENIIRLAEETFFCRNRSRTSGALD